MTPDLILRRADRAERANILAVVEAALNATYGGLWTHEPLTADHGDWARAWLAQEGDRIVGVGLSEADRVSDLWILPAAQGRGAGRALLAALEAEIAARGFALARLRCLEPNLRARAFYAAQGWRQARIYPHETLPLNTVDMTKALGASGL